MKYIYICLKIENEFIKPTIFLSLSYTLFKNNKSKSMNLYERSSWNKLFAKFTFSSFVRVKLLDRAINCINKKKNRNVLI